MIKLFDFVDYESIDISDNFKNYKKLMNAVLFRAIKDYADPVTKKFNSKFIKENARNWFYDQSDSDNPFSFLNICDYLNYCPEKILKELENTKFQIEHDNLEATDKFRMYRSGNAAKYD